MSKMLSIRYGRRSSSARISRSDLPSTCIKNTRGVDRFKKFYQIIPQSTGCVYSLDNIPKEKSYE